MSARTRTVLVGILAVAVVAIFLLICGVFSSELRILQQDELSSVQIAKPDTEKSQDLSEMKIRLKTALARFDTPPLPDGAFHEDPPVVSKEVVELHEKTQDHYFEMAPKVLEEMLQEQSSNHAWSKEIEEAAQEALNYEESQGTTLNEIDCREKLCKITFDHMDMQQHDRFMNGNMDGGPWITGATRALGHYKANEDGSIESFIYFTGPDDHETFLNMRRRMAHILDGE